MAVRVHQFVDANSIPAATALFGTRVSSDILSQVSRELGNSTMFGQAGDPLAHVYTTFLKDVVQVRSDATELLSSAVTIIDDRGAIMIIDSEEQLENIPPPMWPHLLTSPTVRPLFEAGQIFGFGLDITDLPDEDVAGRLINNGTIEITENTKPQDLKLKWQWSSTDPDFTIEELEMMDMSRAWFDNFLESQMRHGGSRVDPSNYPEGRIVTIK